MYKILLIFRYLHRKIAPMFAVLAVTLCTAMVIIVISVMGGFLSLMTESAKALEGHVTIEGGLRGFAHYEQLLEDIRALPQVAAAAPMINSYGLINIGPRTSAVHIFGIRPREFDKVIDFKNALHWTPQRTKKIFPQTDLVTLAMQMKVPHGWPDKPAPVVLGIAVSPTNKRNEQGQYDFDHSIVGRDIPITLTAMLITQKGLPQPQARQVIAVNEFKSGLYEIDKLRVFVDFDFLQKTLMMHPGIGENDDGTTFDIPGRINDIVIKSVADPDIDLDQLRQAVQNQVDRFKQQHPDVGFLQVQTWLDRHATFLGAIEKEKFLLTILFATISLVAVAMIGVIFYMIVLEKTHDIGVLRAMGASRSGIIIIFLGYGTAVGVVGAGIGLALAGGVVYNINEIQSWLTQVFGFTMWDPRIYYFDKIPARLDFLETAVIMALAVTSGLIGALIPAIVAGRLKPVEALRYE